MRVFLITYWRDLWWEFWLIVVFGEEFWPEKWFAVCIMVLLVLWCRQHGHFMAFRHFSMLFSAFFCCSLLSTTIGGGWLLYLLLGEPGKAVEAVSVGRCSPRWHGLPKVANPPSWRPSNALFDRIFCFYNEWGKGSSNFRNFRSIIDEVMGKMLFQYFSGSKDRCLASGGPKSWCNWPKSIFLVRIE